MYYKNQTPVSWLLMELSKNGFFYVTSVNYEKFVSIILKAQELEIERLKKVKTHQLIKFSFSLN
jgi:hypothetical protein